MANEIHVLMKYVHLCIYTWLIIERRAARYMLYLNLEVVFVCEIKIKREEISKIQILSECI